MAKKNGPVDLGAYTFTESELEELGKKIDNEAIPTRSSAGRAQGARDAGVSAPAPSGGNEPPSISEQIDGLHTPPITEEGVVSELSGKVGAVGSKELGKSLDGAGKWGAGFGEGIRNGAARNMPLWEAMRDYNSWAKKNGGEELDPISMYILFNKYDPTKSVAQHEKEEKARRTMQVWDGIGDALRHIGDFIGAVEGAPAPDTPQASYSDRQKAIYDQAIAARKGKAADILSMWYKQRADERLRDLNDANIRYKDLQGKSLQDKVAAYMHDLDEKRKQDQQKIDETKRNNDEKNRLTGVKIQNQKDFNDSRIALGREKNAEAHRHNVTSESISRSKGKGRGGSGKGLTDTDWRNETLRNDPEGYRTALDGARDITGKNNPSAGEIRAVYDGIQGSMGGGSTGKGGGKKKIPGVTPTKKRQQGKTDKQKKQINGFGKKR